MLRLTLLSLVLLLGFAATPASAQSNYATLSGTVYDPQREAVPGAAVRATNAGTRATRQVATNEQGAFQLTGLLPGEYELTVEAKGFAAMTRTVNVEVGQQLTLDVDLKLTGVSTTVEVKDEAAVLRTTDASVGEVGDQHRPDLQHPQPQSLARRGAGVPRADR